MSGLPVPSAGVVPAELADSLKSAADYAAASKSEATRRAYRSDWQDFARWCAVHAVEALPAAPATLAAYLAQLADRGRRVSTIRRRLAAIAYAHRLKGLPVAHDTEAVRAVMAGIRRTVGVAVTRKAPATARALAKMTRSKHSVQINGNVNAEQHSNAAAPDLRLLRDRALLLLGFAAALRRSELVALDVDDLEFVDAGLIVHKRRSKTDQDGAGAEIAVPHGVKLKPVAAVRAWLESADLKHEGGDPIFRPVNRHSGVELNRLSDRAVDLIVKNACRAAHLKESYSAHSLRAGHVTEALARGAGRASVKRQTGHASDTMLDRYDREADPAADNSSAALGL